jgi:hypothetical protein
MRYFLWIVSITLLSLSSRAEPIVEMGSSARAYGMGGALTALADDESAVFYNPAGLASLSRLTISAFYQRAFDVVHHIALTGAARSWGAQLIYIDTGPIESTNEFGNPSGELTQYAATAILVGTAFSLGNLSLGVRGKLFGDPQQTHWGIDLGALVHLGILRAGIVTENLLGSRAISWRVAIASVFAINPRLAVTPALEVWDIPSRPEVHAGLEISINGAQIRLGYDGIALSTGAGVHWRGVRLDWAYRMHPQLPASTIVTVAYLF